MSNHENHKRSRRFLQVGVALTAAVAIGGLGWWAVDEVQEASERTQ